jgi:hypothetical protein
MVSGIVGGHGIEEFDRVFFTDEAWFHLSGIHVLAVLPYAK